MSRLGRYVSYFHQASPSPRNGLRASSSSSKTSQGKSFPRHPGRIVKRYPASYRNLVQTFLSDTILRAWIVQSRNDLHGTLLVSAQEPSTRAMSKILLHWLALDRLVPPSRPDRSLSQHLIPSASPIQPNQPPQRPDLRMIAIILHPIRPNTAPTLKQKLATNLHRIPTAQQIPLSYTLRILQTLAYDLDLIARRSQEAFGHVVWFAHTEVEIGAHPEAFEEGAGWIRVDGEGAVGELSVMRDDVWLAAADYYDVGCDGDVVVVLLGYALRQGLDVGGTCRAVEVADEDDELAFVAIVFRVVQVAEFDCLALAVVDGEVLDCGEGGAVGEGVGVDIRVVAIVALDSVRPRR